MTINNFLLAMGGLAIASLFLDVAFSARSSIMQRLVCGAIGTLIVSFTLHNAFALPIPIMQ
jgi:uncharacterized membrane protein YedE/YeeE